MSGRKIPLEFEAVDHRRPDTGLEGLPEIIILGPVGGRPVAAVLRVLLKEGLAHDARREPTWWLWR